jgi:hypothetical protein
MSESFSLLLSYPGQVIKRYLAREKFTRLFAIFVLLLIILFVGISIYVATIEGLNFISKDIELKDALYFYIAQLFYLLVFVLSFGNSILVIAASFARKSHQWIMATPSFSIMVFVNLFQLLASSLWIFIAVIFPVLIGIAQFMRVDILNIVLSFLLTTALIVIGSMCGVLSYMLSVYLLKYFSKLIGRNVVSQSLAIILLVISSVLMIALFWRIAIPQDFVRFFEGNYILQMQTMREQLIYLPTFGISQTLHDILFNYNMFGDIYTFIFVFLAIILLILVYILLKRSYLILWQMLQEGNYVTAKSTDVKAKHRSYSFPSNNPVHTIIDKELLLIWRDKKNILWFMIVIGLWLAQTAVSLRVTSNADNYGEGYVFPKFVYALTLAIGLYFISALALRFVFPTFSAERKVSWILGVAPISPWNIAVGKLITYTTLFLFIGSPILIANFVILGFGFFPSLLYWIVFSLSVILLVLLAIFLSIAYPNRFSSDPETLSTTLPGLAFTSLALGGSIVIANIMYLVLANVDWVIIIVIIITIINLLLTSLIYNAAEKFEYSGEIIA